MAVKKSEEEIRKEEIMETADEVASVDDAETEDQVVNEEEEKEPVVTEEDLEKERAIIKDADPSTQSEEVADMFIEQTLDANQFAQRTVNIPDINIPAEKRKLRKAFAEDEAIIGDEIGEIDTFAKLKKREYDYLVDSAKSAKPKVLYGRIDGIEEVEIGSIRVLEVVAHLAAANRNDLNTENEITSNIYKIKIPVQMLTFSIPDKYFLEENYNALKTLVNMRIKSIVEFVVYDVDPTEEVVLASSVTAKQLLQYDWYLGKRAKIKPGVKAKGHIVYINSKGVVVNVMGAEVFIKNSELRWGFVDNPLHEKNNFYIGKSVPVRILSVATDSKEILGRKYPYVKIEASMKDAIENPNVTFFDKYIPKQIYNGVIAYHMIDGNYIVKLGSDCRGLNGDGVMCMCKAPSLNFGAAPYVGQEVKVAIIEKDEKTHKIRAVFQWMDQKVSN